MAKCKSIARVRRGDPQFEREYLVSMGLVKPAAEADQELEQLRNVVECCEYLLPIAQAAASPGNAPELVGAWLAAVAANARKHIANGGMGVMTPMATQTVDRQ